MRKGFLFSSDFVIALVLVVFFLGTLYAFYYYKTDEFVTSKKNGAVDLAFNVVMNTLAMGPRSCDLTSTTGAVIKKVAFCWNNSVPVEMKNFGLSDVNIVVLCKNGNTNCLNISDQMNFTNLQIELANKDYIAKDVNMWIKSQNLNKAEYLSCIEGNCPLENNNAVRIYVWR